MIENNPEVLISVINHQKSGPEKVQAVQPVNVVQPLPDGGKSLPQKNEETALQAEQIDSAVRDLNEHIQSVQRELLFSIDKESGQVVITVQDAESQEVIRQIPNEEALRFARMLSEGEDLELLNTYT